MKRFVKYICFMVIATLVAIAFVACNDGDNKSGNIQATFEGFSKINDTTYAIVVANADEVLNFSDVVGVDDNAIWTLTTDIQGNNTIASKVATLAVGDNTYYVLVTDLKQNVKLYTMQIRRRPIYEVSFSTSGGTFIQSQFIEEDDFATQPSDPVKTGYTFIDWNFNFETAITARTSVVANWSANKYKITYFANDGTNNKQIQEVTFGSSVTLKDGNTFSKQHYDLVKWNTKADGSGVDHVLNANISNYNTAKDIDLYAVYLPIQYSIAYDLDGGTNGENPLKYSIESNTIVLDDATKSHYDFGGWYLDELFENRIYQIQNDSQQEFKLYAKYTPTQYTINYSLDGGTNGDNPAFYTIQSGKIILEEPSKEHYDFQYWYINSVTLSFDNGPVGQIVPCEKAIAQINIFTTGNLSFNNESDPSKGIQYPDEPTKFGDLLEIYAVFTPTVYTIIYHLDGGTNGDNPTTYTVESDDIIFVDAIKDDYTFCGWYSDSYFENKITKIPSGSSEVKNIYALFEFLGGGQGTESKPFKIQSAAHLKALARSVNQGDSYSSSCYVLLTDIDLENMEWIPIGNIDTVFTGTFDGSGHIISNFKITTNQQACGLFGVSAGIIKNVGIANSATKISISFSYTGISENVIGSIVAYNQPNGLISACFSTMEITYNNYSIIGVSYAGGLVGKNYGSIINSYSTGNVSAYSQYNNSYVGGLVAASAGVVENCFSTGNVSASTQFDIAYCGGLIGTITGSLKNSFATGNVRSSSEFDSSLDPPGESFLGGIIGNGEPTMVLNVYRHESQYFQPSTADMNEIGTICTGVNLSDANFYTETLGWASNTWNLDGLNFSSKIYPTLKTFSK